MEEDNTAAIFNVFKSWKACLDNQIIISNQKAPSFIKIDDNIMINGVEMHTDISNKSTILFSSCENLNIYVGKKINHIIIERSNNINLKFVSGLIGGIDVLHSNNINFDIINQDIFYISFGAVSKANMHIEARLALNTLISSLHTSYLTFIVDKHRYITNLPFYEDLCMLMFIENELTNNTELHYLGNSCKGVIQTFDKVT